MDSLDLCVFHYIIFIFNVTIMNIKNQKKMYDH